MPPPPPSGPPEPSGPAAPDPHGRPGSAASGAGGSPRPDAPSARRRLLVLVVPAVLAGAGAALVLLAVSVVAGRLEDALWRALPGALGVSGASAPWIFGTLCATGVAVGLVVWRFPGGTGPDPATRGLIDPPLPLRVLPGVAVAVVLGLAGGVSLGPENPVTSLNIALACALGLRALPGVPVAVWAGLAAAGTIGALFGTPVAAALVLSEAMDPRDPRPLWDRLFAPLVAAGAGAVTTVLIDAPVFAMDLPPYPGTRPADCLAALVIATASAAVALTGAYAFPYVHGAFHRLRHPVLRLTAGGAVLGALGVLGGTLTLFKGLDQIRELAADPAGHGPGNLALLAVVKLAALLVAACCGFQGGRIFPAVFTGVALGMLAHALVPAVPLALAVTTAVLGVLLATTRQGWLSLFVAAALAADLTLLPLLCVAALPAWLLVTGRPVMVARPAAPGP
ncbi:ion channel protein [Streptomyces sp. LP05-1]|uniref:Ion channel protein n=1 Tax=Streptomyces pyxinae TaxID=2970734 RepID=A0ABT2CM46_9ACTN|nr:ion channel protein [Streptomyces sp. LP05-1]MCS0638513.1 ion channel protein [Streptomyces sp. LP05-1]